MTYAEVLTVYFNWSRREKAAKRKQADLRDKGELNEAGEDQKTLSDSATNNVDGPTMSIRKRPTSPVHESSIRKHRKVEGQEEEGQGEILGLLRKSVGILKRLEKEIPRMRHIEKYLERMARDERRQVEESSSMAENIFGGGAAVKDEKMLVDNRDGMGNLVDEEDRLEVD